MRFQNLIVALMLIAGIVLYINVHQDEQPVVNADQESYSQPQFISHRVNTLLFDQSGNLRQAIETDHMEHFDELGFTHFENPRYLIYSRDNRTPWQIAAQQGTYYQDGRIQLENEIIVTSLSESALVERINSDYIEVNLTSQTMYSPDQVSIFGRNFSVVGQGMSVDMESRKLELTDHVETRYHNY